MVELLVDLTLFFMLVTTAIAITYSRHLFGVVMMAGVFSLLSAMLLVSLDAVDVAFTEAAVGAGISSVLMLSTLTLTARIEKPSTRSPLIPLLVVTATGAAIIYGTLDMPSFGDPNSPAQLGAAAQYLANSPADMHIPNVVTVVLASYRGFDTLGEAAVVFTAGVGVLLLLSGLRRRRRRGDTDEKETS
ncbi:MAG TPA: cation:proton antiporter [Rhodobacteraceae bacterium]|jgi:multicomponent Na+:H+ antiporter subunit B|nr:cation:proton antiporter [Paracoccaceae bacterium]